MIDLTNLAALSEGAESMVIAVTLDGTVLMTGGLLSDGLARGLRPPFNVFAVWGEDHPFCEILRAACKRQFMQGTMVRHGALYDVRATALRDANGDQIGVLANVHPAQRGEGVTMAQMIAGSLDPLTGLPNRIFMRERAQARLRGSGPCAVALVDIDNFKTLNDSLGSEAGDVVLQTIARRIGALPLSANAVVGRFGGDELIVLLPMRVHEAQLWAQRALAEIALPLDVPRWSLRETAASHVDQQGDVQVEVTASIGISARPDHGSDYVTLVAHADSALRHAKQGGRAGVEVYNPAKDDNSRNFALVTALRTAIRNDELSIALQPTVRVTTGELVGYEALARWTASGIGPVEPSEFIALAEESSMIDDVFDAVLDKVMIALVRINGPLTTRRPDTPWTTITINVAPRQLSDVTLPQRIAAALHRYSLPSHALILELTEVGAMNSAAYAVLVEFKRLGIVVVIDDYGTGYSNMARLRDLSADQIVRGVKLDRSFIADLAADRSRAMLTAFQAQMTALRLDSFVEGIETQAQLTVVRDLGYDYAQGYLFGTPMTVDEALDRAAQSSA